MPVFDNTSPAAAQIIAASQPLILANEQYLQQSANVDHNATMNTATAQDGYHKVTHFVQQGADPATIAAVGQLYTKAYGGHPHLFFESDVAGAIFQLTGSALAAANGWVNIGGIYLQWGTFTVPGGGTAAVTFPMAFPTNCYSVSCQQKTGAATGDNSRITAGPTVAGFSLLDKAGNVQFYIAIGN